MKSKKLLALIIVVAALIVVIVVLASVFAVRDAVSVCRNFYDEEIDPETGDFPSSKDILSLCKGKSILFLSKDKLLDQLNEKFPEWHAITVVRHFPNIVEVHFVKRVAIAKLDIDGGVYLDSFGYVIKAPADGSDLIDITSLISGLPGASSVNTLGKKFQFVSEEANARVACVLDSIVALWSCKSEISYALEIFGRENVFTFNADGDMTITTSDNAKIVVMSPVSGQTLINNLIKAYSVYCNDTYDLRNEGVVITVHADGKITTPGTAIE